MDFDVAEEEQFSPNKLRAQIERLYMEAVGVLVPGHKRVLTVLGSWFYHVQTTPLKTPVVEGAKTNIMFLSGTSIHFSRRE
jgi:hypothetical protein